MLDLLVSFRFFKDYFLPALDVLLLFFFIYQAYCLLVQTRAVQLIRGAIYIGILYLLAFFLQLQTLLWIMNLLAPSVVIAIAIIFQPEIRRIFLQIGQRALFPFSRRDTIPFNPQTIIEASEYLSKKRRGALIVISRSMSQVSIMNTGCVLDASLEASLLLTIFEYDTHLHDGAVVIENGRIAAASCLLPLSEGVDIRYSFGTRHRAALGLAEESNAIVVIVSEENGAISLAYDGKLHYKLDKKTFREDLKTLCSTINISNTREVR